MKKSKLVALTFAVFAIGVTSLVAVAAASAETAEWLCANALVAKECLILSENLSVMTFQDRNAESEVQCEVGAVTDEGWVGPGAEDEVTKVAFNSANCKASGKALNLKEEEKTNKCTSLESIGPVDLPWHSVLELINTVAWDTLKESSVANGPPGYEIMCKTLIGLVTDRCTVVEKHEPLLKLENLPLEGTEFALVDAKFIGKPNETFSGNESEFAECSVGGKESGVVTGEQLLAGMLSNVAATLEAD